MKKNQHNDEVNDLLAEIKTAKKFSSFKEANAALHAVSKPLSTPGADKVRGEKVFSSDYVQNVDVIEHPNGMKTIVFKKQSFKRYRFFPPEMFYTNILTSADLNYTKAASRNYGWKITCDINQPNGKKQTFITFGKGGRMYRIEKKDHRDGRSHYYARRFDKATGVYETIYLNDRFIRAIMLNNK